MRPSSPSLSGTIGRYEILRRLGQGAMGRVLLANDPVLERVVALKLLRDDLGLPESHRQQLFERMRQEARASARISHPNIVTLFDMGEDPALGIYLVFEYVRGETLKDHIGNRGLDRAAAATLARQLGQALTTAHHLGVLHRDIKPENVILSPTGAKIADFGIARLPESTLTRDGRLLGTPAYSAPESISRGEFSPASDQFSFAATLYEALSQRRAFPGDDAVAVATLITTTEPSPIASSLGLPAIVDKILFRALAKDPRARFETCELFGNAIAQALEDCSSQPSEHQSGNVGARPSAAIQQDVGNKTTRVVVGAATLGALLMAALLQATRGYASPRIFPLVETGPSSSGVVTASATTPMDAKRPTKLRSASGTAARSSAPRVPTSAESASSRQAAPTKATSH